VRPGVLALQGDWAAHIEALRSLGFSPIAVRTAEHVATVDALILPGGESTAMLRLMEAEDLDHRIIDRIREGLPVLATCAGLILLARGVEPEQPSFGVLDVDVVRNAYGRQVHSTVTEVELNGEFGTSTPMEGVFIRAPRVTRVGPAVQVLGRLKDDPVLVRDGGIIAATFHPELTSDQRIHRYFCDLVDSMISGSPRGG
jgi:5'-phosphate synthase pdxT subunit